MKKHLITWFAAIAWSLITATTGSALERSLFVINGLAETLSRVNLESQTVTNNIEVLGLAPNQIFIDNVYRRDAKGYVINSVSSDLQVIDLTTGHTQNTIPLGVNRNPYSLAFIDDSLVAVTNLLTGTLSEVDTKNSLVRAEYAVGKSPEGLVEFRGLLFVCITAFDFGTFTYGQGEVAVVDPALDSVIARLNVGTNPQAAVIDYENDLLVLCTGDFATTFGMIYIIDPVGLTVTDSVATGGSPGHLALSTRGDAYITAGGFVGAGDVYTFDTHTHAMKHAAANPIHVGTGAVAVATDIFGKAYTCDFSVDQVSGITGDSVVATYLLGDGPGFAAVYEPIQAGDANADGAVDAADVIYILNFIFKGGPQPPYYPVGDVTRDCIMNASDLVTLVNYVFKSAPPLPYGCY